MATDEVTLLKEENARLKAELVAMKHQWERELIIAKANLLTVQEELETVKASLRAALIRTIEAEDEVFNVREDAAKAVQAAKQSLEA